MTMPFHGTPRRFPPFKPRLVLTTLGFKYGVAVWRVYMPCGEISQPLFTFKGVVDYLLGYALRRGHTDYASCMRDLQYDHEG